MARHLTEERLIDLINETLADLETGPLSDSEFTDTEVDDGQLELWKPSEVMFAVNRIDTPQLARVILAEIAESA